MATNDHRLPLAPAIDVSAYTNPLSFRNKLGRALWGVVWLLLFRPSPRLCFGWRRFLLRCFGARVGAHVRVHSSCKIWAPWNLEIGAYGCLSFDVDCYCVAKVRIGAHATVSQYSYLCTASHDISDPHMRLITAPILICAGAWVAADAFIGPGVTVGEGAVVAVRSSAYRDVAPWTVVGGNPARFLKKRLLRAAPGTPAVEKPPAENT